MIIINTVPKPQSRPRFNGRTKKTYTVDAMQQYRQLLRYEMLKQFRQKPYSVALTLEIKFFMPAPQKIARVKKLQDDLLAERIRVDKRPDIDNLAKAVMDSGNGVLYEDDSLISKLVLEKVYSLSPRIEIGIEVIE